MGEEMELIENAGGKIVSLFRGPGRMNFPAIAQVDAYWEGLRDGRLMPERAEIDPRGLESALEFAFILEHIAPGVGRIRVAGMHLSDILGMEVRGMPLTALFAPDARARISRALEAVVTEPQVADLTLSADRGIGRPALKARLYLAPLGNGEQSVPRVLGCLQAVGDIGRTPRRFGVDQVQMRRIVATTEKGAHQRPAPTQRPIMAGFADASQPFSYSRSTRHDATDRSHRPSLRLIKSDE